MALNNFYTVVNNSNTPLEIKINNQKINISSSGEPSTGHLFDSGEDITVNISGHIINLYLPDGENSWSTIVYSKNGFINIFPSSSRQYQLSY